MREGWDEEGLLVAGLRAKDPGAMERLYDIYARRAFGLAYQLVRDGEAAEDIVQESFLALWRHAERIDPSRGRLTPLLLTVVHHKAIDHLRGRKGRTAVALQATDAGDAPDPADQAVKTNEREAVRAALRDLPAEQRRAVRLAFFAGYSHSQVAAATKAPLGTVKSRLRLALDRLRFILQEKVRA